jgi:hypothetical protein
LTRAATEVAAAFAKDVIAAAARTALKPAPDRQLTVERPSIG